MGVKSGVQIGLDGSEVDAVVFQPWVIAHYCEAEKGEAKDDRELSQKVLVPQLLKRHFRVPNHRVNGIELRYFPMVSPPAGASQITGIAECALTQDYV